uniref:NAC domain-containing protein n=1 Tax=Solanum lycopersicum TaxID=4081 RepID=A0A3Q7EL50_SOLLC
MVVLDHHQRKRQSDYCFYPNEREVLKYLVGFVTDEPLPGQHRYMQRVDLYAEKEPWEILEGSNTNTGYFITPLKKEKSHHTRFKRIVGEGGTWKIQDPAKKVLDEKGCDDGKKKDENIMNEVEVNELIDSVMEELEEIDDDNREVDVGDDFLAALEDDRLNSEENEISKIDANNINLDEYDFVI